MYKKRSKSWLKHLDFILIDLLSLQFSFMLAYWCRIGFTNPFADEIYRNTAIVAMLISISVSVFAETFKNVLKRGLYLEGTATIKHVVLVVLFTSFYLVSLKQASSYSRIVLYLMGAFYGMIGYSTRVVWKYVLKKKKNNIGKRSLLILTVDSAAEDCVKSIKENSFENFEISGVAVINRDRKGETIHDIPVVAQSDDVIDYIAGKWVDEVLVNIPPEEEELLDMEKTDRLIQQISEMGVVIHRRIAKKTYGKAYGEKKEFVEQIGIYTVLTTSINYASPGQLFAKRALDILGGLVGTFLTGVLFLVIAPVILVQSPGPVFFGQKRVGKNGKIFTIYKFRSMYLDAEERKKELMEKNRVKGGMMFKLDFDPRIIGNKVLPDGTQKTGFMELCRKYSLDEFPQFWNVLKGDMSLVGTRPPTLDEYEMYQPHHHARLATKPGITGMWQVSGRSNITDFEEVVKLDTQYIENWSIGLDLKILVKTVDVVLRGDGAM